jgi:hypothetical protein
MLLAILCAPAAPAGVEEALRPIGVHRYGSKPFQVAQSSLWDAAMVRMLPDSFANVFVKLWKVQDVLTKMINNIEVAKEVNQQIREACRLLDESAALVCANAPESASEYVVAVGRIFEVISSELFDPIYRQHAEIAPPGWV